MLKRFTSQLSWRRIVAMTALLLVIVVLSTLNIRLAWQKYQEPQIFPISEEKVAEVIQTQPEFVEWIVNDLGDEDGGILNMDLKDVPDTGHPLAKVR